MAAAASRAATRGSAEREAAGGTRWEPDAWPGEVSASGTSAATPNGTAQTTLNTGLITLEVPPKAAQLIGSIAANGIYLSLLPTNYTPEAIPKLDFFPAVLPGEDPNALTPYGPAGFQSQK